ncbi:MAG: 50S ribosomal subunit stability factor [Candidatus Westeberhardia cardiocondylae]|nr:50S ribosomal subunit stability factor [Candidatus Westeberhardia cardiocondylae]
MNLTFTIALIGRKNVGKSALFNKLTNTKNFNINYPIFTRDRKYGKIKWKNNECTIIDTGGLNRSNEKLDNKIKEQSIMAINESNMVLLVTDGSLKYMEIDKNIAQSLRNFYYKKTIIIINKKKSINLNNISNNIYSLGIKEIFHISKLQKSSIEFLKKKIFSILYKKIHTNNIKNQNICNKYFKKNIQISKKNYNFEQYKTTESVLTKISIIGRPNVGKSTFINCVIGKKRTITHNKPGTTQENIYITTKINNKKYMLIDTAGINKYHHIKKKDINISHIQTIQAIKNSNIVLLLIDIFPEAYKQNTSILNFILKQKKILIILINKCDLINNKKKNILKKNINFQFKYNKFIQIYFISAKYKIGISNLFQNINTIYENSIKKINTALINKIMHIAIKKHNLPIIQKKQIKLKYAHIVKYDPLIIIIHGSQTKYLSNSYKRYLTSFFYKNLGIKSIPIQIKFKENLNPFLNKN